MADPLAGNPHCFIGRVQGLLAMVSEPNRNIYRMTPELLVERLAEIMAEYDAAAKTRNN